MNGSLYTGLLSKTWESLSFNLCCISLKSESKVSSDLKTILKTNFANLQFLELWERWSMSINLNYVAWENSLKLAWSKKDRLCVKLPFTWRNKNLLVLSWGTWYWLFLELFEKAKYDIMLWHFKNKRCLHSWGIVFQISDYRKCAPFWLMIILKLLFVSPN